jgi:hypothetical protein
MATWAGKRKFTYGSIAILIIILLIVGGYFAIFYKKPSCFDGIKNGSELDVDCGGSCSKLCQSAFLPPKIAWGSGKFEKISNNLYNLASYIINPNTNGAAVNVPYKFTVFDKDGLVITERNGRMNIPARRNSLAFETAVDTQGIEPVRVTFEFTAEPQWFKSHDTIEGLSIIDKKYLEEGNNSSLEVTLENKSLTTYKDIIVAVVLYDEIENAIGFSRTIVDSIDSRGGKETAPFTWPVNRQNRVVTTEVLTSTDPVRDR